MRSRPIRFWLGAYCVAGLLGVSAAATQESALDRLTREGIPAIEQYGHRLETVRGNVRMSLTGSNRKGELLSEGPFCCDHGFEKVELTRTNVLPDGSRITTGTVVYCLGEDSAFVLDRTAGRKVFTIRNAKRTTKSPAGFRAVFGNFLHAPHSTLGTSFAEDLKPAKAHITDVQPIEREGRSLIQVRYEKILKVADIPRPQCVLLLDPGLGWVCREYDEKSPSSHYEVHVQVEYGPPLEGVALPTQVTFQGGGQTTVARFSDWSFAATPIEEFTLAHYGLSDVTKPAAARFPWWLVALGAALAVVAALTARYAYRRVRAQNA